MPTAVGPNAFAPGAGSSWPATDSPASPQLRAQHLPAVLLRRYVGSGYLHRGRTPRELALSIGVDPAGLTFGYLAALHAAGPQRADHCQPGGCRAGLSAS
ncbi:hypothetical protein [Salinifilum ghardaiensis]